MTENMKVYDELGCKMLAAAIVEQAAKDAGGFTDIEFRIKGARDVARENQREMIKRFFCDKNSPFTMYMPNTDGAALYDQIMNNYKKYGNYKPPTDTKEGDVG